MSESTPLCQRRRHLSQAHVCAAPCSTTPKWYLGEGLHCIPPLGFQINTAVRMSVDAENGEENRAKWLLRPVGQAAASSEGSGKQKRGPAAARSYCRGHFSRDARQPVATAGIAREGRRPRI